jgi:putative membrane protein
VFDKTHVLKQNATIMKKVSLCMLLLLSAWTFQSCNNTSKKDSAEQAEEANDAKDMPKDDSEFAVKAASGGMMEVELGKLAKEKAQSQKVKDFGDMMVADHSKANEEFKTLTASKNMTIPATLSEDHQKHVDDLSKLTGAEFDKEYVNLMVDDHKEDIDLFKDASYNAKDPDIKAFAGKTLPTLQKHYDAIKAIQDGMK